MPITIPYVISDDISTASRAFEKASGLKCPSVEDCGEMTQGIAAVLRKVFRNVEIVSEAEMTDFYLTAKSSTAMPLISLCESLIYPAKNSLQLSRGVNENLEPLGVIARKQSAGSQEQQIGGIIKRLQEAGQKEIALVDDVVFSGSSILNLQKIFNKNGIKVKHVYAAILVGEGRDVLKKNGLSFSSKRFFSKVIDEVCARDFMPGIYGGGRTCLTSAGEYKAIPYLSSYGGDPGKWASIPPSTQEIHAAGCDKVARIYWKEMRRLNGRIIQDNELDRPLLKGSIVPLQKGPAR